MPSFCHCGLEYKGTVPMCANGHVEHLGGAIAGSVNIPGMVQIEPGLYTLDTSPEGKARAEFELWWASDEAAEWRERLRGLTGVDPFDMTLLLKELFLKVRGL